MEDAPGVAVKTFSESFLGQNVHFYVLRLKESFLLWVGTEATFKTLAVAMNIKLTRDAEPACSQLLGDTANVSSSNLAKRLVKKTGCQCCVSFNVPDTTLYPMIEEYILRTVAADPGSFHF